jgi:hypothetical protein
MATEMMILKHQDDCVTLKSHMAKAINIRKTFCQDGCDPNWPGSACYDCKCYGVADGLLELADYLVSSPYAEDDYVAEDNGKLTCEVDLPKAMRDFAEDWCLGNPSDEAPLWVRLALSDDLELYSSEACEQAFIKAFMLKHNHNEAIGY